MPPDQADREDTKRSEDSISVTELRRNLAAAIRRVREGEHVHITQNGQPTAVLVSAREYERLVGLPREGLPDFEAQFHSLIEKMQTPEQRRGVERFFRMTGEELGEAARQVDEADSS